jgi:hypothetical protein
VNVREFRSGQVTVARPIEPVLKIPMTKVGSEEPAVKTA